MDKKQWQKPELIVLVRSKPEEAVLQACKGYSNSGVTGGPDAANLGCILPGCPMMGCAGTAAS